MEENTTNFDVQAALKEIVEYVHHLADEIAEVKVSVIDNLITPIQNEYNQMQYDNALSDFRCKYAEKLDGFNDKLKAIEGDDFDVVKKTFDDFMEDNKGYEMDEYVDEKANKIQEQLDVISKAFGFEPEEVKEVTVETKDGEETKAEVEDGEVVATESEATEEPEEAPAEEPKVEAEPEPEAEKPVEEPKTEEVPVEEPKAEKKESISDKIAKIVH